jgi:hypothetical protein
LENTLVARQVFQHRAAGSFGLVESVKWRTNDLDRATASVNWTCGEYAAPPVVAVPVYYGVYAAGPVYYGGYANRSYITGRPTLFPRYYGW